MTKQWFGGFNASVTIQNLGPAVQSWTLVWSFTDGQQLTNAWNTNATQSGAQVTARNASWNGTVGTNGSVSFGFGGTWSGVNSVPRAFTFNGIACSVNGVPPAS
jgi:cellulase/cellobiase CelA1